MSAFTVSKTYKSCGYVKAANIMIDTDNILRISPYRYNKEIVRMKDGAAHIVDKGVADQLRRIGNAKVEIAETGEEKTGG